MGGKGSGKPRGQRKEYLCVRLPVERMNTIRALMEAEGFSNKTTAVDALLRTALAARRPLGIKSAGPRLTNFEASVSVQRGAA